MKILINDMNMAEIGKWIIDNFSMDVERFFFVHGGHHLDFIQRVVRPAFSENWYSESGCYFAYGKTLTESVIKVTIKNMNQSEFLEIKE